MELVGLGPFKNSLKGWNKGVLLRDGGGMEGGGSSFLSSAPPWSLSSASSILFLSQCSIEWFHFACVGLTTKPRGKW